jgi:rare lipoprotein A
MTKTNRLSFVVPLVLTLFGAFASGAALGQGFPQQIAMWHPAQWPEYGPAAPHGYWGERPEAIPEEATSRDSARRSATPSQRHNKNTDKAGKADVRASRTKSFRKRGIASWYGKRFHGRKTASGQRYNMHAMTAAHRTLPIPSYVRVTNPANGASVVVLINDRGPYVGNRIIDLSHAAASALGITKRGTATVELDVIPAPVASLASAATAPDGSSPLAAIAID